MKINVATYNIWGAQDYEAYLQGVRGICPEKISDYIFSNDIAICGLEEVDRNNKRSGFVMTPDVIADTLTKKSGVKHYYAYASAINDYANPGSQYGNAIISRYPIKSTKQVMVDVGMGIKNEYEPRIILAAELDVEGKPLTLIVTHFGLKESERQLAVEKLEMLVKETNTPMIFMGDLNTTPGSYIYNQIAAIFKDSSEDINAPLTFSSDNPRYKIDYVFGKDVTLTDPRTDAVLHSDHLPLTVTLDW